MDERAIQFLASVEEQKRSIARLNESCLAVGRAIAAFGEALETLSEDRCFRDADPMYEDRAEATSALLDSMGIRHE